MRKKQDPEENFDDDKDDGFIENLKNAIIEIKSEGFVDKGKIMEIKERRNDVMITYKSRWGEISQLTLYFDEFQEIKDTGKCNTMDGEIIIRNP